MERAPDDFGYEPDDNGDVHFLTVESDFVIHDFNEYMAFMAKLVQIAEQNEGVMPVYRPRNANP